MSKDDKQIEFKEAEKDTEEKPKEPDLLELKEYYQDVFSPGGSVKKKQVIVDEEVLLMVSYLADNDEVCAEGFLTKRFAAEIAVEEAKVGLGWVDIVEPGGSEEPDTLVGSFRVTEDLVSLKIINKNKAEEAMRELELKRNREEN